MGVELFEPTDVRIRNLVGFPIVDADVAVGANINADKIGTGVVDNTEFDRLNGITSALEEQGNKGAVSGYAGLDAFQELLLANFPSGAALQVLRRDAGNVALEFSTPVSALDDLSDVILAGPAADADFLIFDTVGSAFKDIQITGDVLITKTGVATIQANAVNDGKIVAHVSTKITINAKGQLNSNIVYTDQANIFGDFDQTFKDNRLRIENPAGDFEVQFQTSAEGADRVLTIPLLGANRTMVVIGLANQLTNTELTAGAFVKITGVGTLTSGTWNATTIAIADGGTGQTTQQAAINALTNVSAATNEHVLTKDTGTGNAIFKVATGGAQTPWLTDIDADGNSLQDLDTIEFRDNVTPPAATVAYILWDTVNGMIHNVPTGDLFDFQVAGISQMTINVSTIDFQGNTLTDILDITSITSLNGVAIANYILTTDNISDLSTATKAQYDANVSDGTFAFLNQANTWTTGLQNMAAATLRIPNSDGATVTVDGDLAFDNLVTDFTTGVLRVFGSGEEQGIVAMPIVQFTTPTGGDVVAYNATNDEFELVPQSGGSQSPWVTDIDAASFDLRDVSNIEFVDPTTGVPGPTVNAIYVQASGMIFNTVTGNLFEFSINDVNEMTLSPTELNLQNNKLANVNPTTITDFSTVTAVSGDFIWFIDATDGLSKKADAADFLGGASQTPWTSNIDAADFSLNNLDKLEFNNNVDTPVITQAEIYFNTATTGMNFNVPTGDEFTYRINGTIEMTVNVTELDLLTLNIVGAGTLNTHTIPGGTDTFALLAASQVFTNKDILSNNNRVDIGTFEIASEAEGDVIFRNATVWIRLPRGTDNQALVATASTINYESLTLGTHVTGAITDLSDVTAKTGTGTTAVFDTSPIIVTPTIASFVNATHDHQAAAGGGTLLSTSALSDTADIAYLNTANTFGAFLNSFAGSTMRIPVSATPTIAVDGDFAIDTTITDFTTPLVRYFGTESMVIVAVPDAQIVTPTGGHVITYNATNDEFELIAAAGGSDTPWTVDHVAAGFDLNDLSNLEFRDPSDSVSGPTINAIYVEAAGMVFNTPTGNNFAFSVNDVDQMTLDITTLTLAAGNNIVLQASGALGLVTMGELTTPVTPASNTGSFYVKDVGTVSTAFFIGDDGVEKNITTGVGDDLGDHTATQALDLNTQILQFVDADTTITTITNDLEYDVAAANEHRWRVNNTNEMILTASALAMQGNSITGINRVQFDDSNNFIEQVSSTLFIQGSGSVQVRIGAAVALDIILNEIRFAQSTNARLRFVSGSSIDVVSNGTTQPVRLLPGGTESFNVEAIFTQVFNRFEMDKGGDVASPAGGIMTLGNNGNTFDITGTNTINEILATNWLTGSVIHLQFDGILTVTHNSGGTNDILLGNGANMTTAAGDVLTLYFDGVDTDWHEISRSVVGGGGEVFTWTADHSAGGFDLNSLSLLVFQSSTDVAPAGTVRTIYYDDVQGMLFNALTGDFFQWEINAVNEMRLTDTALDLQNNNLIMGTGILQFVDADHTIQKSGVALQYDVPTGGRHEWRVNNVPQMVLDATELDLNGILTVNMNTNGVIRWSNDSQRRIANDTGGFTFDVITNDIYEFKIGGGIEMTLNATALTLAAGNNIVLQASGALGLVTMGELTTPVTPTGNSGSFYVKDVGAVSTPFFIGDDGVEKNLTAAGSEVFTWTADHDADGNALLDARFADDADATKIIDLNLSGMTTGIVLTLLTAQTTAQTITIPNTTGADDFVLEDFVQTLTGKTLTTPTIVATGFTNMQHTHLAANTGGTLTKAAISDTPWLAADITLASTDLTDTAVIVLTNQINTFGDFVQTFKDNSLHLENPAGTFDVVFQTSAEVTADRILTIPLLGANRTMVVTGLTSQITIGTEVTGAITDLSDVTAKTGTGTTAVFDTSPIIVTPTIASFVNATHDHTAGAGGGLLTNTALTSGVFTAITGLGAQSQTLDMGANIIQFNNANETIQILSSIMTFDVASTFSHAFRINNVNELTISPTAINAPNGAFQEAGIPISPIGIHDQYWDGGSFISITAGTKAETIIGTGDNRKGVLAIAFANGANEFATIKIIPPRNYNNGTITVVVHFTPSVTGTGNVIWGIAGVAAGDGDDLTAVGLNYGTEITVTDAATTVSLEELSTRTAAITLANTPADGDAIYLRFQRRGGDGGDTFSQPVLLLGASVAFSTDAAVAA